MVHFDSARSGLTVFQMTRALSLIVPIRNSHLNTFLITQISGIFPLSRYPLFDHLFRSTPINWSPQSTGPLSITSSNAGSCHHPPHSDIPHSGRRRISRNKRSRTSPAPISTRECTWPPSSLISLKVEARLLKFRRTQSPKLIRARLNLDTKILFVSMQWRLRGKKNIFCASCESHVFAAFLRQGFASNGSVKAFEKQGFSAASNTC